MESEPWTVRKVARFCAEDLARRGMASARLESELMVAHALGITRVKLYMDLDRELAEGDLAAIRALLTRRRKHEPMAYLLGRREFYGRDFSVSPAVLIPRPETELLVERALAVLRPTQPRIGIDAAQTQLEAHSGVETTVEAEREVGETPEVGEASPARPSKEADAAAGEKPAPRVLDLCTGSGCVAITLALEIPEASILATDVSAEALGVAAANARALGAENVSFRAGDLFGALVDAGPFEVIVANPPYLAHHERGELAPDVRDHEPALALFGGTVGDELVRRIIDEAAPWLAPDGLLAVEIGAEQGPRVASHFASRGFREVQITQDLAGRDRVVEGRAPRG